MKVRYTETALIEVEEILRYIAERNRTAAIAMRERLERTVAALAETPEMAQAVDEPGVRRMPIRSHPYLIFTPLKRPRLSSSTFVMARVETRGRLATRLA